jgi:hypothetical protein
MPKMKTKIAFSLILASIVLLVAFPQYGLLALSEINAPQIAALTAPNFSVSANPSRLYVIVGDAEISTIRVSSLNKFNGTVDLDVAHVDGLIANLAQKSTKVMYNQAGYAELSIKAQPKIDPGTYNVTVTASSDSLSHSVNVTVRVLQPDFAIKPNPWTMYILNGTSGTSNVTLTSIDRFNGTIALSASGPFGWAAPTLGKNVLTLNYPKLNSTILTVNVPASTKSGKYTIVVTAESGNHGESDEITHSVTVTVQVINPDFRIYASPSTMYLLPGTSQGSTIRVYSVDRFNGTVTLAAPIPAALKGSALTSTSLAIKYNIVGSSMLNVNVPLGAKAGKYVITVEGQSGLLTHSVNVTVQVIKPDIVIYSSPSYISVKAGTTQNATVRVASLGRFNGTVTLTATSPSGWTTTIVVSPLQVTYNQSNSTKITIAIPAVAEPGKYTVEFTGTSGLLSDSTSIKIVVVS